MSTQIKIKTWSCECGYHQDFESTDICPSCKLHLLKKQDDPKHKITITVLNESDIDLEIKERQRRGVNDIDLSTLTKRNAFKKKRISEIQKVHKDIKKLEDK